MKIFAATLRDAKTVDVNAAGVDFFAVDEDGKISKVPGPTCSWDLPYLGRRLLAEVEEFEKVFYKTATPGELLTYWRASPEVDGGEVVSLSVEKEINGQYHEIPLADWQLDLLDLEDNNELGCIEDHPEGSDRGGYVPTLSNGCFYDENGGCWQG